MTDFLVTPGTPITFQASGGTAALTLTSLANNAARQSVKADLGANHARRYSVTVETKINAAPTAGSVLEVWANWSSSGTAGTDNMGGTDGTDAAYKAAEEDEWKRQLDPVGGLISTADGNTVAQRQVVGVIEPRSRYVGVVVVNKTGQALSGTAGDHIVTLTPLKDVSV